MFGEEVGDVEKGILIVVAVFGVSVDGSSRFWCFDVYICRFDGD